MPSEEQTQAFFYLLDNEAAIQKAVVDNILAAYPRIRDRYCPEGRSSQLPTAVDSAELKRLIGPSNIHILKAANRGFAYVGFEFGCTWDGEHGLGVVTHEDRVVTLGSADTSFDENVSTLDIN